MKNIIYQFFFFSLFVVLMYTAKMREGFDDSGPTLAQITNPLLLEGELLNVMIIQMKTKNKQYTLYEYMKPGLFQYRIRRKASMSIMEKRMSQLFHARE